MTEPTIDWPARHMRAKAHLELLKAEWARAREKKVAPRYIAYQYEEKGSFAPPPAPAGRGEER